MKKELKIKITDIEELEQKLNASGAIYIGSNIEEYTYFTQPSGKVLKIIKKNNKYYKNVIEKSNDKFKVVQSTLLKNPEETTKELEEKFGLKKTLINRRTFYEIADQEISINIIENVGVYLIVLSQNPTLDFIKTKLDIANPGVITDSFDNL